ncbi:MAG: hypothetical protein PV347_03930, partial [Rickettsiaceae bacterium]|nr:hypothetical protein [Rickettsiaceae bacterium]
MQEFVPQCYKVQQVPVEEPKVKCAEPKPEAPVVQEKVEVAVQTKEEIKEVKSAVKQSVAPLTNGHVHKNVESPIKAAPQPVTESVRKVQIVCVEKPSPISCSTPRSDQWTTVKSSRSKNKKGRQETSSASPTSPVSDVASENTFGMFIEGNVTPPPSEEDGSLEIDKPEDNNVYFTSDDTVDNNEEANSEESNSAYVKKNNKVNKSKSKKSKKTKENTKNKTNSNDIFGDEKKNNKSRTVNGKPHKYTKQVNLESVKSNLAQLLGPTNMTEIDFTKIQSSDKMNGIGIEELKELYCELPELKDQRLENLLEESHCRIDDDYVYNVPVLSITENIPKTITSDIILPPTPEDSSNNFSLSKDIEDNSVSNANDEISASNTDSE